ncbi:MAG: hypothetical protein IT330_01170, partial [Anaerolineae bacterium]|nr:hypothetical protein [Anaerolineae bacterium]
MTLQTEPDTRLRGRWLLVARTTWIVVALLGIGFLAAFAPLHLRELRAGNFSGGASFYVFYYLTLAEA